MVPGFYVWEVPGKPIAIQLSLDVVDRLQQDVIRGFGMVPRRGAEVGGVLLGKRAAEITRVEDYELIPIEYKRGPSYLLSQDDEQAFDMTFRQLRGTSDGLRPIGFFRSHTRDGIGLGEEDLDLIAKYFPEPEAIVLLIRPFGTKPSVAGFYFKEDGEFQSGPPLLEFPFSRRDLAPDDVAAPNGAPASMPRRVHRNVAVQHPARERREPVIEDTQVKQAPESASTREFTHAHVSEPERSSSRSVAQEEVEFKPKRRRGLFWAPLSFIFLLLGLLLGFQAALTWHPQAGDNGDPYAISLGVTQSGSDLLIRWDRTSPIMKAAQKGVLTIDDGTYTKAVDLDPGQLQNGGIVVYRHSTNDVRLRLQLFLKGTATLTETAEWKQP